MCLSVHLLMDRHLGCFQFLASTNRTLYNHMLSFLLGKCLRVECLGHMVGVGLTFEETAKPFSKLVVSL